MAFRAHVLDSLDGNSRTKEILKGSNLDGPNIFGNIPESHLRKLEASGAFWILIKWTCTIDPPCSILICLPIIPDISPGPFHRFNNNYSRTSSRCSTGHS
ncbi:unnamed protein product [Meganyctiphanes norvegica]|uniref:Uncharacterized protein n=1 Tax=Meganyctiphanes norvegica TaxID=48144 RepID=A0AAV2PSF1_MEGNR